MMGTSTHDIFGLVEAQPAIEGSYGEPPRGHRLPEATRLGRVRLQVADLEQASAFFSEALGFDRITWSYPGALFLGAGGYHHHLGTNIWAGAGAQRPEAGEARLLEWTLELPDRAGVERVARSLAKAGPAEQEAGGEITTRDPWSTAVRMRVAQD